MQSDLKRFLLNIALITWLTLCLIAFLSISRMGFVQLVRIDNWPAFWEMLAHIPKGKYILDLLYALAGILIFSFACLSLGLFILRKWLPDQVSRLALGATGFVVGEIIFSLIYLTAISVYRLTPLFVAVSLLLGLLVGFPSLKIFISSLTIRRGGSIKFDLYEKVVIAIVVVDLLLGLSLSFTRLGYDATAYYFSHAKIMAVSQLPVFFYPNDSFIISSFHPGILFTANIQLFGDQAARIVSWTNGIAILLMGLAIAQFLGYTKKAQLWFLVLMVTSTAFIDLLGDGKVELISTAPILAAIYWMLQSTVQPSKGQYLLIGSLAGFAIISRPYNIFLVSLFIALLVIIQAFIQYRAGNFHSKQFIQSCLWIGLPLLALAFFHLFQNWVWLKDPIAPLTYARNLDSTDWQWTTDPENVTFYKLLYPLTLTFLNSQQSLGNISPLLVGLLPFLLIKGIRKKLEFSPLSKQLFLATVLTLLAWISLSFTVLEIRYVMFLWVIIFLAAAQLFEKTFSHDEMPFIRTLLISFLIVMCVRTFVITTIAYFPMDNTAQPYCPDSNLCKFIDTLNHPADPGDRVFVLHAYRYYLRPDLFACSSQVNEYYPLQELARRNPAEFWVALQRLGFRYIMYEKHLSEHRYHFGKLPSLDTVPDWMDVKVLYANSDGTQMIYKLDTTGPPITPEVTCQKNPAGIWNTESASLKP